MFECAVEDGLRNPLGVVDVACCAVYGYGACHGQMHAASGQEIGGDTHAERPCRNNNLLIPFGLVGQSGELEVPHRSVVKAGIIVDSQHVEPVLPQG